MQNLDNRESENRIHPVQLNAPPQPPSPAIINNNQQIQRQRRQRVRSFFGMIPSEENLRFIEQNRVLLISGKTQIVNPETQGYFMMLRNNFFPHLQWYSLPFFLIYLCTIVYVVEVAIGFQANTFLEVSKQTYIKMGVNSSQLVYRGQVYRLIVSIFLHVNLIHLVANMFCLLIILAVIQYTFGWEKTLITYICSGVFGNIFSDLLVADVSASMIKLGASNSLYGMLGLSLGYLIINWTALGIIGPLFKFKIILIIFLTGIFMVMYTDQAGIVDYLGHLGGFLAGIFISGFMPSLKLQTRQKILRGVLAALFIIMGSACFVLFYLAPQSSYSS